jgi:hypothetical protein
MDIVPRFLLVACCYLAGHCSNVRRNNDAAVEATQKVLAVLNVRIGEFYLDRSVKMLPTDNFLTGRQHSSN